ncbi:[SSU ribosomal protein S18P]-alanine acetyltransferase [Desulforamulus reducens MI-1]|uniref:[SSU ribosomal protein S18P]-alanine acetyltransferase n=1 Tax=Desulforamulus reducens (strain ATCC BAA-1160 / DSM 100696 / MI-1) TaxID=349161 RepID=A4J8I7_DESRM|nr:ribosomal protein S18-alanine N-acetyltransferase [Desulforamulus reducens]ABO51390.1 [SSU ribosomal protein S18P]-alanine acetyltransferase [Desulforamulus reducens MI-1]
MDFMLAEMTVEHIPGVLQIEQVSFPTPWSQQSFTYEITQNNFAVYLVAIQQEKVIAYAGMWLVLDEAHITNIAVHPDYRGKKIGKALLLEMMRQAVLRGAMRMTLEVRPSNYTARQLYEKVGFKEKGLRKKYYTDTNEDAIIMWVDMGNWPVVDTMEKE